MFRDSMPQNGFCFQNPRRTSVNNKFVRISLWLGLLHAQKYVLVGFGLEVAEFRRARIHIWRTMARSSVGGRVPDGGVGEAERKG